MPISSCCPPCGHKGGEWIRKAGCQGWIQSEQQSDSGFVATTPQCLNCTLGRHSSRGSNYMTILIVMGVSGSGKTTLGHRLAERLGWPFQEGDDYHPAANVVKMS